MAWFFLALYIFLNGVDMKKQFANNIHNRTFSNKFILFSVALIVLVVSIFACIAVIGNTSSNQNSTTITTEAEEATGPTNTAGWWIDEGRYSIDWFTNAQSVVIDGVTYKAGTEQNPYIISSAQDLAGLSWLVYTCGQSGNPLVSGTDYSSYYTFRGKYFKQTANIDLSEYYWQPIGTYYNRSGSTSRHYFSGSYDGGSYIISGVFTPSGSTNAYSYQGLFGYIYANSSSYPITIKNIGITNSNIQGYHQVGGVVGYANASSGTITITNCYNTGSVSGTKNYVGGVVGYAVASGTLTITNCYNTGSVSGSSEVGGVVGYAAASGTLTITNCYNTGSVTGTGNYVGGVVGYAYASSGTLTITNCYNTGSVTGTGNYVGGVVGGVIATLSGNLTITNCYNTGSVSGTSEVGGVVGRANASSSTITITSCYYGVNCSQSTGGIRGSDVPGQATYDSSLTTETPKTLSWYTTEANWNSAYPWEFENVWTIDSGVNDGYPSFKIKWWIDEGRYSIDWFTNAQSVVIDGVTYKAGTKQNPYIISSAQDLAGLSWLVYTCGQSGNPLVSGTDYSSAYTFRGKYFKQTANIDLSEYYWQPIGTYYNRSGSTSQHYFSGSYDGGGYTVSGIFTPSGSRNACSYQGLFGYICANGSSYPITIKNIGITNSNIQGYTYVGGVVGYAFAPSSDTLTITNCYNTGSVTGSYYGVGGVVGQAVVGQAGVTSIYSGTITITNCYNTGSVEGGSSVGGVVGYAFAPSSDTLTITNCYNTGSVEGGSSGVGGVVGVAGVNSRFGTITITNCYNTGSVAGIERVGGVVGEAFAYSSSTLTITNCYNTGSVTGTGNYVGGVVGRAGVTSSSAIYISKCANLGDITLTGSSSSVGGIIGYVQVGSASGILQVANCYSEGTIFVQGASATVGGFVGGAYANYSTYSNVYFEFCAVDMNVSTSGSGSISSQGAFYGGTYVVTAKNSYSILNGAKSLTSTVNEMDNNFAYILNFKDGKPLPLGLYAISQFGTETNIVERINAL